MSSLAQNKQARFNYDILETYEAGLVLSGPEVKSVKGGHISLKEAFVTFQGSNANLTNAHISLYRPAGPQSDYDPTRSRKLLLKRKEIDYLRGKALEKGLTIVPLNVYTKKRFIKVEIAVGKGRHSYDKRDVLKKRDIDREVKKQLKM